MSDLRLTSVHRLADRASDDRAALDALLDAVPVGVLSTVLEGEPWSVPILVVRDGDRVLLHGSTGAGLLRHAAGGAPVTLTVVALDGLVVAHNAFDSSANYRSAVLRGRLERLADDEALTMMDVVTHGLLPGRPDEVPAITRREAAATVVLALPIEPGQWLYKARSGGSGEPAGGTRAWTGVIPLALTAGEPVPDAWNTTGAPVPPSVERTIARYRAP